jgi:molecular chaperone GrpE
MPNSPESDEGDGGVQVAELEELERRNAELDDRYKRALADLDNYRKRVAGQMERRATETRDAIAAEWLEVVDSVERALLMAEPDSPLAAGLRAVLEQMEAILARQGIRRIGEAGEPFDPERHDAVGVVHVREGPDRSVAEVARSGYAVNGRVLRPAEVVVAQREDPES